MEKRMGEVYHCGTHQPGKTKNSKLRHKDKIWKDTWANYSDLGDLVLKEGIYVCPLILFEMFALCIV